jgi:hypothetical protein
MERSSLLPVIDGRKPARHENDMGIKDLITLTTKIRPFPKQIPGCLYKPLVTPLYVHYLPVMIDL